MDGFVSLRLGKDQLKECIFVVRGVLIWLGLNWNILFEFSMKSTIKSVRNRVQIPANAKQIQNYYYYPDRIIGSGNYSVVYEAFSMNTSKKVLIEEQRIAAKVINLKLYSEQKMVELLEQEIQILLTLDHPNIIKCHDVLKTSEECYCFT